MTEPTSTDPQGLDTHALIQRRLVGLAVLLTLFFLLSLLLRTPGTQSNELPTVVIPLNGSGTTAAPSPAAEPPPVLDQSPQAEEDPAPEPAAPAQAEVASKTEPERSPPQASAAGPSPAPAAKAPAAKATEPTPTRKAEQAPRWFVSVGAFKDPVAARAIADRVRLAGLRAEVQPITITGEQLNRVRAGPFSSRGDAESARASLIVSGLTKATISTDK